MHAVPRRTYSALLTALFFLVAPKAWADAPTNEDEYPEPVEAPPGPGEGVSRVAAPDLRRGAILVSVGTSVFAPIYDTLSLLDLTDALAPGVGFRGALGLGLSRHVSLELQGSYGLLTAGTGCSTCSGSSLGLGAGLTYHLAQGIAFDPWASFGVSYRTMTVVDPRRSAQDGAGSYSGWDFARIALGGTYYPVSFLGFGPYIEAAFGGFRLLPDGRTNSGLYSFIDFGLRVTFDPLRPGKLPTKNLAISY